MKTTILSSLLLTAMLPVFGQAVLSGQANVSSGTSFSVKGTLTVNSSSTAKGILLNNGTLKLTDGLILKSDDASDGLLANKSVVNTSSLTASNVQLHRTFSATRYYYVSFPFPVAMNTIKSATGTLLTYGTDYYMREYDAATRAQTGNPDMWVRPTAGSTLAAGKGYLFALDSGVANREVIFPANNITNLFSAANKTINLAYDKYTGGTTTGNSWGWNFVGGLGTANYDMAQSISSNFSGTLYYYDQQALKYQEFNSKIGDATVIPPYTPFFTHEAGTGKSIVFNVNGISINATQFVASGTTVNPVNLRSEDENPFDIISLFLEKGESNDRVRIVTADNFSEDVDYNQDAAKLMSPSESVPQVWSMVGKDELCINMLPKASYREVMLGVKAMEAGEYTLRANDYHGYYQSVVLLDKANNNRTDLLAGSYTFAGSALNSSDRFVLELNRMPTSINEAGAEGILIYANNNQLFVKNIREGDLIRVYDVTGRLLVSEIALDSEFSTRLDPVNGALLVKVTGSVNKVAKVMNQ